MSHERSQINSPCEDEPRPEFQLTVQLLDREKPFDLLVIQKPKFGGQLAEELAMTCVFLNVENLVDLLDAQQIHAKSEHADCISGIGPFPRFRDGMVIELQAVPQKIEERIRAGR